MSDGPSDDEFVEISLTPPPAEDGEAAAAEGGDDQDNGTGEADGEAESGEGADAEGDGGEGEGDGEEGDEGPLRDERVRFKGAEARIAELTRLRRQAERERDQALAQLQGARDPAKAAQPKPTPDDYEDYGDYVEALTDWKADQRDAERREQDATRANTSAEQHRSAEWGAKIGAAKAVIADFDAVMEKADTPTLPHVADAIMDADRGPELLYHLAGHPEIVERLNEMSPARAAMELGKIEATLGEPAAPPAPPARKTTTAPAPITPVKPGATTAKDPAKMNQAEYNEWRKGQLAR